jgi:hypothetical protein
VVASALVALTLAGFWPVLDNEFLTWDDDRNFSQNESYRGFGWPQIRWAWTTANLGAYQPVAWMALSGEWCAWGVDPRGYHAASLLLHAATAVALYALTLDLLRIAGPSTHRGAFTDVCAALAVAWYAVHPLRVEAVAWASCQPYLLCALFLVLSVLAYLRAQRSGPRPGTWWLRASLVLYGLSVLSKATSISLPGVLLILDVYPLRRLGRGRLFGRPARAVWREKVGFVGIGLVVTSIGYLARTTAVSDSPSETPGLSTRLAAACYGVCFYIYKTVVPRDIAAHYLAPGPLSWSQPIYLASLLAVVGVSVALFLVRGRWPGLLAAWAAMLVLLVPVSGLVSLGSQLVASRYSYFAAMAWVPPIAWGMIRVAESLRRPVALAAVALAGVCALVPLTRDLCRSWHDTESLWTHALTHGAGRSMLVYNNLGTVYHDRGRLDLAIRTYRAALAIPFEQSELTPRAMLLYNLGSCLVREGKVDEAVEPLTELVRLVPQVPDVHYHLGVVLYKQGRFEEALAQYKEAKRLEREQGQNPPRLSSDGFRPSSGGRRTP